MLESWVSIFTSLGELGQDTESTFLFHKMEDKYLHYTVLMD